MKKAKHNSVRKGTVVADLSEERILDLSNDLSENVNSGTVREWRAVACYFRSELDRKSQDVAGLRISLTALAIGEEMKAQAMREIRAWLAFERKNQKKGNE